MPRATTRNTAVGIEFLHFDANGPAGGISRTQERLQGPCANAGHDSADANYVKPERHDCKRNLDGNAIGAR